MDDVPFAFCQSVASLLSFDDYPDNEPLSSTAWQNAIDPLLMNRIDVICYIGYKDGVWSYSTKTKPNRGQYQEVTFEELLKLNRLNLRVCSVTVTGIVDTHQASFEEITKLVKFVLPSVNMAELGVFNTEEFPLNDLLKLLSLFRHCSVRDLRAGTNCEETWAALSVYPQSESLKRLHVLDKKIPVEMKTAVTEYLLNNRFQYFMSFCPALLGMDMLEFLFNKPQTEPAWEFRCDSSIKLQELREFQKHLQCWSDSFQIQWKREDGLIVTAYPARGRLCIRCEF